MVREQAIEQLCGSLKVDEAVLSNLPSKEAELVALVKLIQHFAPRNVLEIGTSKGYTACAIRSALGEKSGAQGAKSRFKTLDVAATGDEFKKRLNNFVKKTEQNKLIGFGGIEKYY